MREWTETHREGTHLGPVDWDAPWPSQMPQMTERQKEWLREIIAEPDAFLVSTSGGEIVIYQEVISVGMYDGWPYWQPAPALLVKGPLGGQWEWAYGIRYCRRKDARP